MPVLAELRPSAPPPGRVPFEHIGQASALRQAIARAFVEFDSGMAALLEPFQGTNRTSSSRKTLLKRLQGDWRKLEEFGRLKLKIGLDNGATTIFEVRCCPTSIYELGWTASESALAVVLYNIRIEPRAVRDTVVVLAIIGQHALARRFERGRGRGNIAVLRDLLPLLTAWPSVIKQPRDFSVEAGDGAWRGEVTALQLDDEQQTILSIRTYVA